MFRINPFLDEDPWKPHLLNGPGAVRLRLIGVLATIAPNDRAWFLRPVADDKQIAGCVKTGAEIHEIARKVLSLPPEDIPSGSLRPEAELMFCSPARIEKEWRLWIVAGRVVTHSLYREGGRVVYRPEIDDDARAFGQEMADLNPHYGSAYVMDVCRTADGLHLLETNCINAAGFYAADLQRLGAALEALPKAE